MSKAYIVACVDVPNINTANYSELCINKIHIPVDPLQLSAGLVTVSVDRTHNQESYDDMGLLFGGFIVVLVSIWGVKQLLNLFTGDTDK